MKYSYALILLLLPFTGNAQWIQQASGFSDTLRGMQHISVVDRNIAWATAYDGSAAGLPVQQFTKTLDGGNTWIQGNINGVSGFEPSMIFALNADTAWVMYYDPNNDGGKILRTNNGGLQWTHQASALFIDSLGAYPNIIHFWNASEGVAMGDPTSGYFEIYTTTDGGNQWIRVPAGNIPAIISGEYGYNGKFSVVGNTVLFGTSKGRVFKSTNKGYNWTAINTPILNTGKARVVAFRDSLNGLIADRINNVYVMYETSNGGASWQAISPVGPVYGNDLRYLPNTVATYISTGDKTGYSGASISHDGGHTWHEISSPASTAYGAIGVSPRMSFWAGQLSHGPTAGGVAKFLLRSRDVQPFISAPQVSPCSGPGTVQCVIKNVGTGILNSVTVDWSISSGWQTPVTIGNLDLLPAEMQQVALGNVMLGTSIPWENVKAITSLPNGLSDTVPGNDTALYAAYINQTPSVDLGNDTSIHAGNSILLEAGTGATWSYLWSTGHTTHSVIIDSSGVGVGLKTISVRVDEGHGCIGADTIQLGFHLQQGFEEETADLGSFRLYPMPASEMVYWESEETAPLQSCRLYDSQGRLVLMVSDPDPDKGIDIGMLSPGIYYADAILGKERYKVPLLIQRR